MWFRFPTVAKEFNYGTNIIIKIYNIKIFSIFNKFITILLIYKKTIYYSNHIKYKICFT